MGYVLLLYERHDLQLITISVPQEQTLNASVSATNAGDNAEDDDEGPADVGLCTVTNTMAYGTRLSAPVTDPLAFFELQSWSDTGTDISRVGRQSTAVNSRRWVYG